MPSTGILSPGLTITKSPFFTCSIGISISSPFLITLAVFACNLINFLMASDVLPFEMISINLPMVIVVTTVAEASKKTVPPKNVVKRL